MADEEGKKRDDDEPEADDPEAEESDDGEDEESDRDEDEEAPDAEEDADEDEAPEAEEEDEPAADDDPEEEASAEDDDRARDVARALGVGDDEKEEEAEAPAEKPEVLNRAERRRRRALKRRMGADAALDEPKDRNKARREELLKRRRRAAAGVEEDEELPEGKLLPGEMVDDALARGRAAAWRWIQNNWKVLQWVLTAVIVGGAATLAWIYFQGRGEEKASDALSRGVWAEDATVLPPEEDQRPEDQKKFDIREIVGSYDDRDNKALEAYRAVVNDHAGSGAAILAKLGEAGVLLDRREWDQAIAAFDQVIDSPLAAADVDVKGRALEGKGFGQEGKKDLDGALATFTKLGELSSDVYKALSFYHQGRIYMAKDQKDLAKEKLLEARKLAEKGKVDSRMVASGHPYRWIERAVTDELVAIDPSLEPEMKPGSISPEKLQELLRQQGLDTEGMPGLPGLPALPEDMPEEMPLPEEPE